MFHQKYTTVVFAIVAYLMVRIHSFPRQMRMASRVTFREQRVDIHQITVLD
jgi:hypothetical protein